MASNRGVVYVGPGKVEVRSIDFPKLVDRIPIAKAVNATVISLDDAPRGYADFDRGVARKFVIDPNELLPARA